jgi:hypothetical protein
MIQNVLLFANYACFVLPTGTMEKKNLVIDVETKSEHDVYVFVKQMTVGEKGFIVVLRVEIGLNSAQQEWEWAKGGKRPNVPTIRKFKFQNMKTSGKILG